MLIAFYRGETPHLPADRTFQFQILRRDRTHSTVKKKRKRSSWIVIKQEILISLRERLNRLRLSSVTSVKRIKRLACEQTLVQWPPADLERSVASSSWTKWQMAGLVKWKATQLREVGEFLLARKCIDVHLRKQWPITLRYAHQRH